MTPPSSPRPNSAAAVRVPIDPALLEGTNINPLTGLATDFLNHFNEAIMLLEMLPSEPECMADILSWRPISYRQHFAASRFKHRDLAIAAYEAADPIFRRSLDEIADRMNTILMAARDGLKGELAPDTVRALADVTAQWLRPLVARAGALINGETLGDTANIEAVSQAAIDALFDREVTAAAGR
jgi:hypothetical protein